MNSVSNTIHFVLYMYKYVHTSIFVRLVGYSLYDHTGGNSENLRYV